MKYEDQPTLRDNFPLLSCLIRLIPLGEYIDEREGLRR
jgi:hypothetical protein